MGASEEEHENHNGWVSCNRVSPDDSFDEDKEHVNEGSDRCGGSYYGGDA